MNWIKLLLRKIFGKKTTNRTKSWYKQKDRWYRYQQGNYQPEIKQYAGVSKCGFYSFNYWYYNHLGRTSI